MSQPSLHSSQNSSYDSHAEPSSSTHTHPSETDTPASATGSTTDHRQEHTSEAVVSTSIDPNPSPTVYVTYGSRSVKARIDPDVPLIEVLNQLCNSQQLAVAEPATLFALREKDTGTLVTDDNFAKYLEKGSANFVLCSSPVIEAVEIVDKLRSSEPGALKLATFSLRTLIKEQAFLEAFLERGGLVTVQDVVMKANGNTLAYALLSLQNLLELEDEASKPMDASFIARIVQIIATEPLINIVRPATAILRRLSMQNRSSANRTSHDGPTASSYRTNRNVASDLTASTGLAAVFSAIQQRPDFLQIVVGRLSSGDVALASLSLGLINSLFKGAIEMGDESFISELDKLGTGETVGNLYEAWKDQGDLSTILGYQANVISSLHTQLLIRVDEAHYGLFDDLWSASGIPESEVSDMSRWQNLGFKSESPQVEFDSTGKLGLKTFLDFAIEPANEFKTILKEIRVRPAARRCPLATVSSAVVLALAEHFHIAQGVSPTPTTPNPYVLRFNRCHALATRFFNRMWIESGATASDFERVATLMRSQINHILVINPGSNTGISWSDIEEQFLKADYKTVRDRQMRELEMEDDVLSKTPVRHLRGRLYLESFEFVRNQRIACLHEGAWFRVPSVQIPVITGHGGKKGQAPVMQTSATRYRFYRLAANRKALHFWETTEKVPIAPGLEDLDDRSSHSNNRTASLSTDRSRPVYSQTLSFALHSSDGILAELIAPNQATYSEWLDGLSLLRPEGSIISSQTADYVHALTEIGVKIKLLDLSGEKVEIPSKIEVKEVPSSHTTRFYYSENL